MAGRRSTPRSRLHRRSTWTVALAAPAGLLVVAATLTASPVESPAASTADTQLVAETARAAPADPAPAAEPSPDATVVAALTTSTDAPPVSEARPEGLPVEVSKGGMPDINYSAYRHAETLLAQLQPQCGINWTLIAAIGRVESTHANNGAADEAGNLLTPILGPLLDGSLGGNAVIKDTDGGELDGDANYDRAVGPTQFLPETWRAYSVDGNGDGNIDPQNLFDAAATTGNYLCHGNLDLRNPADIAKAVLRYNNSQAYVNDVVGFAQQYAAH